MKAVLNSLYKDTCDIYERQYTADEDGINQSTWVIKHAGVKCRLSRVKQNVIRDESASNVEDSYKLFLDNDVAALAGSKVLIRDKTLYCGEPFKYSSHQEIDLSYEEYA